MELYVGMDLHSSNTYFGILNEELKRVFKKRVNNELPVKFPVGTAKFTP